jgi:selenocysteine-specific elongation factor
VTSLVIGVIGHVDHGKTALVRALTGVQTDRLPEEQRRGISIALGFAQLRVAPDRRIDLIDMPGHERFVRTMIAGATGLDAVLLVVAANEGVKPQTIEHIDIAGLLGLQRAAVAITKADLVAPSQVASVADAATALLARAGLRALPAVPTSTLDPMSGIDTLRERLDELVRTPRIKPSDSVIFLPIDRAFSAAGHGPVVTGTLRGAAISTGDTLELLPSRERVRVKAVQLQGARVASAAPGQRVALNLRDVQIGQLHPGMVLSTPGELTPSQWLTISIRAVEHAPKLKNGMRLRALSGTAEIDVRLRLLDRDVLEAGQSSFAQLHGSEAFALPVGEHVVLRLASPPRTVAGGRILESVSRRQRRGSARIIERLEQLRSLPLPQLLAAEVGRAGAAGTTLRQLSQLTGKAVPQIIELLTALPVDVTQSGWVISQEQMQRLQARIPELLQQHAAGLPLARLLESLPQASESILNEALEQLHARHILGKRGAQWLLPRPDQDHAQARQEARLAAGIAETLRVGGLTPPNPTEIVRDLASKRAVDRLLREGVIVRAMDRAKDREVLFHRDAIGAAQERLAPLLERPPGLLVTEVGAALGISRKYSMPLLDHLDAVRFTRRINDRRVRGSARPQDVRAPP